MGSMRGATVRGVAVELTEKWQTSVCKTCGQTYDGGCRCLPSHHDLAVAGIEMVDVEIRQVIAALNRLPFVSRTLFSCAGFGRAGLASRTPGDYSSDDPTGHLANQSGYVTIEYKSDKERIVLRKLLDPVFDEVSDKPERSRVSYYIDSRYDASSDVDHDAYMRAAWGRVLDAVSGSSRTEG